MDPIEWTDIDGDKGMIQLYASSGVIRFWMRHGEKYHATHILTPEQARTIADGLNALADTIDGGRLPGPWLTEWPAEMPVGSRWEWESNTFGGWGHNVKMATFRAVEGGLWPETFETSSKYAWNADSFDKSDRIRLIERAP